MRRSSALAAAALVAAACQAPPPPAPPSEVSIEILGGFAERPSAPAATGEHVEVLLDVTSSLRAGPPGAERYRAARAAAARFLEKLPPDTPFSVRALGLTPGNGCASATGIDRGRREATAAELATRVATLEPAGEGSLAVALAELRGSLVDERSGERSRVVVFTDLGAECGGDLCTAAELLLDAGAQLDFVVLGDAAAPACFASLGPSAAPPEPPLDPPDYRIIAYDPSLDREPLVLAEGRADGSVRRVPAGPVTVLLGFDPPSLIGPLVLAPATRTRIRVVEFPALDPPVREWVWATEPIAAQGEP
jgi:hypothetical protein